MNYTNTSAIMTFLFRQIKALPSHIAYILTRLLSVLQLRGRSSASPVFSRILSIFRLLRVCVLKRPLSGSLRNQSPESLRSNFDQDHVHGHDQSLRTTTTIYPSLDHSTQDVQNHPTSLNTLLGVSQRRQGSLGASHSTPNLSHTLATSSGDNHLTGQANSPSRHATLARPWSSQEILDRTQGPRNNNLVVPPHAHHTPRTSPSRLSLSGHSTVKTDDRTIHPHSVALYRGNERVVGGDQMPRGAFNLSCSPSREGSVRSVVVNSMNYDPSRSTSSVDFARYGLTINNNGSSHSITSLRRLGSQAFFSNERDTSLLRHVFSGRNSGIHRMHGTSTASHDSLHLRIQNGDHIMPSAGPSSITVNVEEPSPTRDDSKQETRNLFSSARAQTEGPESVIDLSAQSMDSGICAANPMHEIAEPDLNVLALIPSWPSKSNRYDRHKYVEPVDSMWDMEPFVKEYNQREAPPGWTMYIHPEGTPYFYHEEKMIITEAYILDEGTLLRIQNFMDELHSMIEDTEGASEMCANHQAVLEFVSEDTQAINGCTYYFVDHDHQSIFWVREFPADTLVEQVRGKIELAHLEHEIVAQYWKHRSFFPGLEKVKESHVEELRSRVYHALGDCQTSSLSTSPYPAEKLSAIMTLMNEMGGVHTKLIPPSDTGALNPILEVFLGEVLHAFAHARFMNFYGQAHARLARNQTLYSPPKTKGSMHHTVAHVTLAPLLFFSFKPHLDKLNQVYVDFTVVRHVWEKYVQQLNDDWDGILLLAEVLLTVYVSFLAIPSVDTTNGPPVASNRTAIQILGYVSVTLILGCLTVVLVLKSIFHKTVKQTHEIADTMLNAWMSIFGLSTLAIIFSLPRAFLTWSIVTFGVAFSMLCFVGTTTTTIVPVSISMGIVVMFCLGSIYMLQKKKCWEWFKRLLPQSSNPSSGSPEQGLNDLELDHPSDDIEMQGVGTDLTDVPV